MARATTKQDLIHSANEQYEKMWKCILQLKEGPENTTFSFQQDEKKSQAHWGRDKNVKDVLVHLFEWHQLLLNWVKANKTGEKKSFLPEPYTWKTYGTMNVEFWEKHQSTTYELAKKMLEESHRQVMEMIQGFTNEELFLNRYFPWTGTTSLGSYCVSATASHYDWAIKKLKAQIKNENK